MTKTVTLTSPVFVGGIVIPENTTKTFADDIAEDLINRGFARHSGVPAWQSNETNNATDVNSIASPLFSGKMLVNAATQTGWTVGATTVLQLVDTPPDGPAEYRQSAATALQVTTDAAFKSITCTVSTGIFKTPRVDVWMYFDDQTTVAGLQFWFATSDTFANAYSVVVTPRSQRGWQAITLNLASAVVTGSPTYETIARFRIAITAATAAGCSFILDRVTIGANATSKCALIWDDGNVSCYTHTIPLLNKHRLIGNFALYNIPGREDQYRMMSYSGHRLVVHGSAGLSGFPTSAAATQDITEEREFVSALGGPGIDSDVYVYPGGVYMYSVNNLVLPEFLGNNGFVGAFATDNNIICPEKATGLRPYLFPRLHLDATTVAATFLTQLDAHIAVGACFATMGHETVNSGAAGYQLNVQTLDDILAGIRTRVDAGSLECVSAKELVVSLRNK